MAARPIAHRMLTNRCYFLPRCNPIAIDQWPLPAMPHRRCFATITMAVVHSSLHSSFSSFSSSPGQPQDCAGTNIPSSPDLGAFANDLGAYGCASAWITNGAGSSFRFPLSQLGLFDGDGAAERAAGRRRPEIYRGDEE